MFEKLNVRFCLNMFMNFSFTKFIPKFDDLKNIIKICLILIFQKLATYKTTKTLGD